MGDITSLPRWAQSKILSLETDLKRAERERDALASNRPGPIYVDDVMRSRREFIQAREVTFSLSSAPGDRERRVRVSIKDGKLSINADSWLSIELNSSNDFRVAFRD